jgi:hypothetical protein
MSEFTHPPIDLSESAPSTAAELFAEEAYQMLATYGVGDIEQQDNWQVAYPVTERVDVKTTDGQEAALRLRVVPCYMPMREREEEFVPRDVKRELDGLKPTQAFLILRLEYGTLNPELQGEPELPSERMIVDEDYEWQAYVDVVIDTDKPEDVEVLDGDSGDELEAGDIGLVHQTLRHMHAELRGMAYTDDAPDSMIAPQYWKTAAVHRIGESVMQGFVPAEHNEAACCGECEGLFTACAHEPFRMQ